MTISCNLSLLIAVWAGYLMKMGRFGEIRYACFTFSKVQRKQTWNDFITYLTDLTLPKQLPLPEQWPLPAKLSFTDELLLPELYKISVGASRNLKRTYCRKSFSSISIALIKDGSWSTYLSVLLIQELKWNWLLPLVILFFYHFLPEQCQSLHPKIQSDVVLKFFTATLPIHYWSLLCKLRATKQLSPQFGEQPAASTMCAKDREFCDARGRCVSTLLKRTSKWEMHIQHIFFDCVLSLWIWSCKLKMCSIHLGHLGHAMRICLLNLKCERNFLIWSHCTMYMVLHVHQFASMQNILGIPCCIPFSVYLPFLWQWMLVNDLLFWDNSTCPLLKI